MTNNKTANLTLIAILAVLCVIETLSFTYFKILPAFAETNAVVYLLSGIGIAVLAMVYSFYNHARPTIKEHRYLLPQVALAIAVLIYLGVLYAQFGTHTYPIFPISYKQGDMLPLIQCACKRFVEFKDVYQHPINEPGFWPNSYIPYLPAMWLTFVPAYVLQADIRWTTLVANLLIYGITFFYIVRLPVKKAAMALPVFTLLFFLNTRYFTWEDKSYYFALTQEAAPAFFYFLLFIALMLRKGWLAATALALCTLSRYSVVIFVPVYFLFLLIDKDYKEALRFVGIYLGIIAFIFIFPFFLKRPQYFLEITQKYQSFEASFWYGRIEGATPNGSLGIAYAIGYNVPMLKLMKPTMLALVAAFSAAWLGIYYFYKERLGANKEIWLMAGFKMALLLFYNLISMPFSYLFVIPTIISYPLLLAVITKTDFTKNKTA